jgi:hypothetical protein
VHFDYELNHPAIVTSPRDVLITAESQHGPIPRIVHYFPLVDIVVIVDANLPSSENLIAFQRRGETDVQWRSFAGFGKGALVWGGVQTRNGKPHICIVSDDALFRWFSERGWPITRSSIQQFVTNGTIPQIPAAEFDRALDELNKIGAR